jgi:hypothetical protein
MTFVESKLMFQRNALSPAPAKQETSMNCRIQEINLFISGFFYKQEKYLVNVVSLKLGYYFVCCLSYHSNG